MGEKPSKPQHDAPCIFPLSSALTNATLACNIRAASSEEGIDAKFSCRRRRGIVVSVLCIRTTACGNKRSSSDQLAQQRCGAGGFERATASKHSRHVGCIPGQEEAGLR